MKYQIVKILAKFLIGLAILVLGIALINSGQSDAKPSWINEVHWQIKPDAKIEKPLWDKMIPFRTDYEKDNIMPSLKENALT